MLTVETRHAVDPASAERMGTQELRGAFHAGGLFRDGEIRLVYTHYDRMMIGGATPAGGALTLDHVAQTGTPGVLDRREMAVVNIGAAGAVAACDETFAMEKGDVVYIGMGAGPVTFSGEGRFYILSAPAHRAIPARLVRLSDAKQIRLGSPEAANERTIYQFIVPEAGPSCQLVVGYTKFEPGSVWNTMPAHLHDRRMEAYLYFDLADDARVFHMMGRPEETRHIVMRNEEAVLSPAWSIHCGAGTGPYTFIWAMAGDNVDYRDVDMVAMETLA
ncbi:5-dehydro-4-deoxy-D-glucuronate isomerase [Rubrimonas cliftonensis]|uniref:4-deoxy-L-threo-5-hexosulose-uronate ketol-isomerase n=1 Tax=Rubrimonas cliftonensis TaxID=89524 RepID=A0A1H4AD32_9RHOB|nr:5-dehydro-4-deoxy-D-glucuronate isomerase [Rubrimonas cliftonensis]SEA33424.1 4-deoxy-L-threo-5-hexosulose-uronate ketol-isomerase [Rubrimonas cliftonensis]